MQFKTPYPISIPPMHNDDQRYIDTEQEIPAMPKPSSYSGISAYPEREWTPPPYWRSLLKEQRIDVEKTCYRVVFVAMGIAMLITLSAFFGKLMVAVFALKITLR